MASATISMTSISSNKTDDAATNYLKIMKYIQHYFSVLYSQRTFLDIFSPIVVDSSNIDYVRSACDQLNVIYNRAPSSLTNGQKPVITNGQKPVITNGQQPITTNGQKPRWVFVVAANERAHQTWVKIARKTYTVVEPHCLTRIVLQTGRAPEMQLIHQRPFQWRHNAHAIPGTQLGALYCLWQCVPGQAGVCLRDIHIQFREALLST